MQRNHAILAISSVLAAAVAAFGGWRKSLSDPQQTCFSNHNRKGMLVSYFIRFSMLGIVLCGISRTSKAAAIFAIGPNGSNPAEFLAVETSPFSATVIGSTGFQSLSGMDFNPLTGVLYASSGNDGRLYTINPSTGAATLVADIPGADKVPGMAFDLDGTLYGIDWSTSPNRLITINPSTGTITSSNDIPTGIQAIDFDPTTDIFYALRETGDLYTINKTTGATTLLGELTEEGTGDPFEWVPVGLTIDDEGSFFGSTGALGGRIFSIDVPNLEFTILGDASPPANGAISDLAAVPLSIPEPSSLALAGFAFASVAVWSVRRRIQSRVNRTVHRRRPLFSRETGVLTTGAEVWTGTSTNGTAFNPLGGNPNSVTVGRSFIAAQDWVTAAVRGPYTDAWPLYAISGELTVVPEPGAMSLLTIGAVVAVSGQYRRARRRRTRAIGRH